MVKSIIVGIGMALSVALFFKGVAQQLRPSDYAALAESLASSCPPIAAAVADAKVGGVTRGEMEDILARAKVVESSLVKGQTCSVPSGIFPSVGR